MNKQEMVYTFMKGAGQKTPPAPSFPVDRANANLRVRLIEEEFEELKDAIYGYADDPVKYADAVADLLYVVYGAAVDAGLDIDPIFEIVHKNNMTKLRGKSVSDEGKVLKPTGFVGPGTLIGLEIETQVARYEAEQDRAAFEAEKKLVKV